MPIFRDNCSTKAVDDPNVPLLLLIQGSGNLAGTTTDDVKKAFDSVNIMNFSAKNACDVQIDRNASGGFTYNSFGKGLYHVDIEGFQTAVTNNIQSGGDIESYYSQSCMAGSKRTKIKITAAYFKDKEVKSSTGKTATINGQAPANTVTYSGYMVDFVKKPLGRDKIPGYGFTLSLLCTVEPTTTQK